MVEKTKRIREIIEKKGDIEYHVIEEGFTEKDSSNIKWKQTDNFEINLKEKEQKEKVKEYEKKQERIIYTLLFLTFIILRIIRELTN